MGAYNPNTGMYDIDYTPELVSKKSKKKSVTTLAQPITTPAATTGNYYTGLPVGTGSTLNTLSTLGTSTTPYTAKPAETKNALGFTELGTWEPNAYYTPQALGYDDRVSQELSGYGYTSLPGYMNIFAKDAVSQEGIAKDIADAMGVTTERFWDYYNDSGGGKHSLAARQAVGPWAKQEGTYGKELTPEQWQKFRTVFMGDSTDDPQGGFGASEAIGLGAVMLPILAAGGAFALGGAGAAEAVGGAGGVGGGGVASSGGLAGLSGPELVALGGGGSGIAAGAGVPSVSGLAGLSGPELVALTGGGAGPIGAGAGAGAGAAASGGAGFLSSLGGSGMGEFLGSGWGNVLQGGLGVLGSYLGGEATKDAADKSADVLMRMYNQSREDQLPLLKLLQGQGVGKFEQAALNPSLTSIPTLQNTVNIDYANDPLLQAQKDEIMRSLNRRYASMGKFDSSDADNAILRNISGLMTDAYNRKESELNRSNENAIKSYGMSYGQDTDRYSRLLDILKAGSGAAAQTGQYAANTGNALAGVYSNQGANQAQMYSGMAGSAMGALNNYQLMQMLAQMRQ